MNISDHGVSNSITDLRHLKINLFRKHTLTKLNGQAVQTRNTTSLIILICFIQVILINGISQSVLNSNNSVHNKIELYFYYYIIFVLFWYWFILDCFIDCWWHGAGMQRPGTQWWWWWWWWQGWDQSYTCNSHSDTPNVPARSWSKCRSESLCACARAIIDTVCTVTPGA